MRWIDAGRLSAKKIGRRVLVPSSEVDRLLAIDTSAVTRGLPVPPSWFAQVSSESIAHGAALLAEVLRKSGVEVNEEGLQTLIRGEERPTPIFWNSLIIGLQRLLEPSASITDPTTQSKIKEHLQAWDDRGRSGHLWDTPTGEPSRDPKK